MYNLSSYPNVSLIVNPNTNEAEVFEGNKKVKISLNKSSNSGYTYKRIRLRDKDGKRRRLYLHKFIATNLIPNPNNYKEVTFKDKNRMNCKVKNLAWVSRKHMSIDVPKDYNKNSFEDVSFTPHRLEDSFELTGDIFKDYKSPAFIIPLSVAIIGLGILITILF